MTHDELKADFALLASHYDSLMAGDTHQIMDAEKLMQKHGFWDEDCFWKEHGDDDEDDPEYRPMVKRHNN